MMGWWDTQIKEAAEQLRRVTDATEEESEELARVILGQGWATVAAAGIELIEHLLKRRRENKRKCSQS